MTRPFRDKGDIVWNDGRRRIAEAPDTSPKTDRK
jgi:hypothetical protein